MITTCKLYAEWLEFIQLEPVREAYRYLIDYAARLKRYRCYPYQNGNSKVFRYADADSATRSEVRQYACNFNKNKGLLFYFRHPAEVADPHKLFADLQMRFDEVKRNTAGEFTVRINDIADARRLMEFVFEQGLQPSKGNPTGPSKVEQRKDSSRGARVQVNSGAIRLPDDVADETTSEKLTKYLPQDGDERDLIERQIRERRGQQPFRNDLRKRYGDRCMVTGCKVLAVLEAAHIKPYQGEKDNHPENGLLLRADIHTLFDLDLLGIEPKSLRVELHPSLADSAAYKNLAGKILRCSAKQRPSKDALKLRYQRFQERLDW